MSRGAGGSLSVMFIGYIVVVWVGFYLTYPCATTPTAHSNIKLDAFIIVNEHNGLSDWGLEQLEQLLDQKGNVNVRQN